MSSSPTAGPLPYAAASDVLEAELGGEAILLHLGSKNYFQLNETGVVVWNGLRDREPVAEIVRKLGVDFGAPPDEAEQEVRRLVGELAEQGLVVPAPPA